eukprot:TRINITY_DN83_c2_g1_i3.p1 TRINITY_DN83_c2_g1~~TRINITY_DN83_c2_g1_i3.p1  ORF type:complete len:455 (+),score=188.77 TRINITY_DN83_c2_g1_i3:82-1446(+)
MVFAKSAAVAVFGAASLLRADALTVKEATPIDALKVQLPKVPQIDQHYVGKDGLPELPTVEKMMNSASATLSSMNTKAVELQAKMTEVQKQNSARLSKQKVIYDGKLKKQEKENRQLISKNQKLAKDIVQVKGGNEKLLSHTKKLQKDIEVRRGELRDLKGLVGSTDGFIQEVLTDTADKNSPELTVLVNDGKTEKAKDEKKSEIKKEEKKETSEKDEEQKKADKKEEKEEEKEEKKDEESKEDDQDEENEDEKDDEMVDKSEKAEKSGKAEKKEKADKSERAENSEKAEKKTKSEKKKDSKADEKEDEQEEEEDGDEDAEPSFISLSAVPDASSEGILTVLTKGLKDLKKEGKTSEEELKKLFLASFKTGEQRHTALETQQQVLHKTLDEMTYYRTKLQIAEKHLEETKAKLDSALHKTGLVLKKLSKVALSPSDKALNDLENMRKATDAKKK